MSQIKRLKPATKSGTPVWFQPIAGGANFAAVTEGKPYMIGQTYGIYGKDAQEVATRFVDEKLQQMFESPKPFGAVYPVVSKLEADARENSPQKDAAKPSGVKHKVTKRKYNYKKT